MWRDGRLKWIHHSELTRVCGEPKIPDIFHCPLATGSEGLYRVEHNNSSGKGSGKWR
jgi:hypothetical protein